MKYFISGLYICIFIVAINGYQYKKQIKSISVQLSLDESELKEQHRHIDLIGGGIETLSYQTDVLTDAIRGLQRGQ